MLENSTYVAFKEPDILVVVEDLEDFAVVPSILAWFDLVLATEPLLQEKPNVTETIYTMKDGPSVAPLI